MKSQKTIDKLFKLDIMLNKKGVLIMKMIYSKVTDGLRGTPIFPLAWIIFTMLLVVGAMMWREDYMTSYYGYESFPTQKATNVLAFVALLPQLIQSAAVYFILGLSVVDKKDRAMGGIDILPVASVIWFLAFVLDGYWDYIYKSAGFITEGEIYWNGIVESFGLFGFGSEVLLTLSLAMWVELTRNGAFISLIDLLVNIAEMFGETVRLIVTAGQRIGKAVVSPFQVEDDKPTPPRNQSKRKPTPKQQPKQQSRKPHRQPPNIDMSDFMP